jgi:hypothetical protein
VDGELRVEVLDVNGHALDGFTIDRAIPVSGNGTRLSAKWNDEASLARVAGTPVRFRFTLKRARLFSFWVSRSAQGQSGGYVAAGGPGFSGETDAA